MAAAAEREPKRSPEREQERDGDVPEVAHVRASQQVERAAREWPVSLPLAVHPARLSEPAERKPRKREHGPREVRQADLQQASANVLAVTKAARQMREQEPRDEHEPQRTVAGHDREHAGGKTAVKIDCAR